MPPITSTPLPAPTALPSLTRTAAACRRVTLASSTGKIVRVVGKYASAEARSAEPSKPPARRTSLRPVVVPWVTRTSSGANLVAAWNARACAIGMSVPWKLPVEKSSALAR